MNSVAFCRPVHEQSAHYYSSPSWGVHSAKMSRRKQQNPRQFPLDSDLLNGEAQNGLEVASPDVSKAACNEEEDRGIVEEKPSEEAEEQEVTAPMDPTVTEEAQVMNEQQPEEQTQPDEPQEQEQQEQQDFIDPDEDIDEEELDEMDYDMERDLNEFPATDPASLDNNNVKLKALENTRVAVAQMVENNFAPAEMIPSLLQTICNLQQQQMFQLQLLQMLQAQLVKTAAEHKSNGSDTPVNGTAIPPAALAFLNSTPGILPLPKLPISQSGKETPTKGDQQQQQQQSTPLPPVVPPEGKFPFVNSPKPPLPKQPLSTTVLDRSQYAAEDPFFKHKCKFCHKVLGSDSALQIHVRSHTGEKPYKCNICGNRFSTKGNLKVHFERHKDEFPNIEMDDNLYPEDPNERPAPPPLVPSTPTAPEPITIAPVPAALPKPPQPQPEPEKKEELIKPDPPKLPSSTSFLPHSIASSLPSSHSSPLPASLPSPMPPMPPHMPLPMPPFNHPLDMPPPPPFGMEQPVFRSSILPNKNEEDDNLEQYMEIDTSETSKLEALVKNIETKLTDPNQCAICKRILSCKSALQMHYRVHTGERPFKCKICRRAFTTKGNLKTHMGVHRSKPPLRMLHQCPVCHKQFTNSLVLQQHIRTHTNGAGGKMFPDQMMPFMPFPPMMPPPGMHGFPLPGMHPFMTPDHARFDEDNLDDEDDDISNDANDDIANQLAEEERPKKRSRIDDDDIEDPQEVHAAEDGEIPENFNREKDASPQSEQNFTSPDNPTYPMSLAALEERVKAIGDRSFGQFAHFPSVEHQKSESNTTPPSLNSPTLSESGKPENNKSPEPPSLHPYGEHENSHSSIPQAENEPKSSNPSEMITPPKSDTTSPMNPEMTTPSPQDNNSSIPDPYQPRRNTPMRHMCQVCQKPFSSSSGLQIHMRSHTGERPFKCDICGKAFTTKGNLKVHMGTHVQQMSPSCRGRRMSVEGIPGLTPPKDSDFFANFEHRPQGTELFPPGFPAFPGFPVPPFFPHKPNSIPVIQNPAMFGGLLPGKPHEHGENNNNAPDLTKFTQPDFFKDKMSPADQGLNLSVK